MDNDNNIQNSDNEIFPKATKRKKSIEGNFKLSVHDWMETMPKAGPQTNLVEVRFKNTRKEYFENVNDLPLEAGDIVAVEASPGHDIGVVSLTGELVLLQLKKNNINRPKEGLKKIYRKARPTDIEKWDEARALEDQTMIEARQISKELKLDMKIGDVEYQGDKTKAIFYYIAEERVDFRELIKVLADRFKIRIEMRQIGARQEAGRIGGIGSCGKELCCASFITKFVSVTTNAARYQELSLNPQKLAGQCGKLKCCLNFEVDSYIDAQKDFPPTSVILQYSGGKASHSKTDVYKRMMWYFVETGSGTQFVGIPVDRVKEIIEMNKKGIIPEILVDEKDKPPVVKELGFDNVVGQESLTRFDEKPKKQTPKRTKNNKRPERTNENRQSNQNEQRQSNQNEQRQQKPKPTVENKEENTNQEQTNNNNNNNRRKPKRYNNQKRNNGNKKKNDSPKTE